MIQKSTLLLFQEFVTSQDTLRVYQNSNCLFKSDKDVLAPLVEFISRLDGEHQDGSHKDLIVLDKVSGNAAALLAIRAGATAMLSPLGSQLAVETLTRYHVEHHIQRVVPYILARNGKDMCPMEKLSLDKTPEEFYQAVKQRF